jgi:amino acid transporter
VRDVELGVKAHPKLRAGKLGWFLCWAVVFADIGTSIYYVPGILHGQFGTRSALFVSSTLIAFLLLSVKYSEVAWRFPEGGGVVNVAARALHPFAGLLGGMFILVDYYLTAAISALSGLLYLSAVITVTDPVLLTVIVLVALGILNALGIRESARASACVAVIAGAGQLVVVVATASSLGWNGILSTVEEIGRGPQMTPTLLITGYAASFLAFSGLETISQLAPAMREPRRKVARGAMVMVAVSIVITSPLLTLWATTLLGSSADPNQSISLLGAHVAGRTLGLYVATGGALLLVFASNTAVIGSYHVFIALSRMGFLPRLLERRNRWRGTPHWAILAATGVPALVIVFSRGDVSLLGDLYAFGLLGAFILTCLSLDIVRWYEFRAGWTASRITVMAVGGLTTILVGVAWLTNLVAKPLATEFGGGLAFIGLGLGLVTYARRYPVIFPFLARPNVPVMPVARARQMGSAEVMVVLPRDPLTAEAVVGAAILAAGDGPLVFLYRGGALPAHRTELLEVTDPYLQDRRAQAAFAQADRNARGRIRDRRYVYIPEAAGTHIVAEVWRAIRPDGVIYGEEDQDLVPEPDRERADKAYVNGLPVLQVWAEGVQPALAIPDRPEPSWESSPQEPF